jgi:ribosomal protein S14
MTTPTPDLIAAAQAVAAFLSGPKDRFGRVDVGADVATLAARNRVRELAIQFQVPGSETYLDQCAAVLVAALAPLLPPPAKKGRPQYVPCRGNRKGKHKFERLKHNQWEKCMLCGEPRFAVKASV